MVAKKLLLEDDMTACVKQICLLAVICKVSNRKTLSGEIFCFFEKRLLLTFKFVLRETYCLFFFFLPATDWPTTNFFEMYCYFPVIRLVNFVAPVAVVGL